MNWNTWMRQGHRWLSISFTLVVAAIYITLCLLLSWLAAWLERRSRRNPAVLAVAVERPDDR